MALVLNAARTAAPDDVPLACLRADLLASRFWARGFGARWLPEHRIPYEAAIAVRRACELEACRFVPMMIRDGRAMLAEGGGNPAEIDVIVKVAILEAEGTC